MIRASQVVAALVLSVVTAHAQAPDAAPPPSSEPPPSTVTPAPPAWPPPPSPDDPPLAPPSLTMPPTNGYLTPPDPLQPGDAGYRSPVIALELSLGFTVVGYGVAFWSSYEQSTSTTEVPRSVRVLGSVGSLVGLIGPTTGHIYAGKTWNPGLKWRLISLGALTITSVFFVVGALSSGDEGGNDGTLAVLAIGLIASAGGYVGATIYEIATAPGAAREHNARGGRPTYTIGPMLGRAPGIAVVGTF